MLLKRLPPGADVLDLGCGAGLTIVSAEQDHRSSSGSLPKKPLPDALHPSPLYPEPHTLYPSPQPLLLLQ